LVKYRNPINKSTSAGDFAVVPMHEGQPGETQGTTYLTNTSFLAKKNIREIRFPILPVHERYVTNEDI